MTRSSRARTGARGEDAVAPGQLSAQGWRELVRRAAKHVVRARLHFLRRGCVLRRPVRRPSAGDRALGLPLDLGRTTRLYTKAQRVALGLRDGGCTARGCETTASGCHATTTIRGRGTASPTWPTAGSCAHGTTAWPTTPAVS